MTNKDITTLGRWIVESISNNDIPYTNRDKCQIFHIDFKFPRWSLNKGTDINHDILQHSHIILTWNAMPHKNSSIIWTNLKQIKTRELKSIIEAIKRDIKIEKILNEKTLDLI